MRFHDLNFIIAELSGDLLDDFCRDSDSYRHVGRLEYRDALRCFGYVSHLFFCLPRSAYHHRKPSRNTIVHQVSGAGVM